MINPFKKYKKIILLFISSFLVFLSYPKSSISSLAFISLIPYIIVIFEIKNKKEALNYGFIYGFLTYILILYWIYPTLQAANVNIFFSSLAVILLASILSIEFIIITFVSYITKSCSTKLLILVLPAIWVIVDFTKVTITRYIAYFPWFMISYSQWNNLSILNLGGFFGSYFITFLIVLINTLLALILLDHTPKEKLKKIIITTLIIISFVIIGKREYLFIEKSIEKSQEKIRIALIQPSIDFYKKWNIEYVEEIKARIENLLKEVLVKKPDLIIWPENALYGWIDEPEVFEWLCRNIKKTTTYHIVGSVSKYNRKHVSAYLIDPECKIIASYNKRILVPFGEYVPLRKILGKFISVITTLGEFESGSFKQEPFRFKNIYILPTICYETAFDYLLDIDSDKEISLIINITNDGWYLDTSAPYQHFAIAVVRAVETRTPFARAANNGISAVIYPNGKIKSILNLNDYNYVVEELPLLNYSKNSFTKNLIVYISFIIISAFFLAMIFRR